MAVSSFSSSGIKAGVKRNKFWDQSAVENSFFSIDTQTVGAGGASYVEFTNIPQTYTHLQIRAMARGVYADVDMNLYVRFNGDTGSNYSDHAVYGSGASAASYGNANNTIPAIFRVTGGNSTANRFGVGVADIFDYSNTNKFKTYKSITGHDQNGSGYIFAFSGNWRSTSAITSIRIFESSGNIAQYSSFALYGIKG